jgi:hypothetical protein
MEDEMNWYENQQMLLLMEGLIEMPVLVVVVKLVVMVEDRVLMKDPKNVLKKYRICSFFE